MYKEFFGFIKEPFNIAPDPELFYCSKNHEEVIEVIEYQLEKRKGFVVLTGEVGTGKTLICRTLINKLYNFYVSYIMNPFVSPEELLFKIAKDFGIFCNEDEKIGRLYEKINDFLIKIYNEGKNAVIIVDEAQHLTFDTFEIIRQISNIELDNAKLIQILLAGQQELVDKLNTKELRQLNQRISTILELNPLSKEETKNYINFRLQQSLKYNKYLFTDSAINKIYEYSKGFPREINQIADIALLVAFSKQHKRVSKSDVIEAAKEYYKKRKIVKYKNNRKKVLVTLLIALIFFLIYGYYAKFNEKLNIRHFLKKNIPYFLYIYPVSIKQKDELKKEIKLKNLQYTNVPKDNSTIFIVKIKNYKDAIELKKNIEKLGINNVMIKKLKK